MGYVYILKCADGSYYTGSTKDIDLRLKQHNAGLGANYTEKRLPLELVYFEKFQNINDAFNRDKQIQGWSRKKKEALINSTPFILPELSKSKNVASTGSATEA